MARNPAAIIGFAATFLNDCTVAEGQQVTSPNNSHIPIIKLLFIFLPLVLIGCASTKQQDRNEIESTPMARVEQKLNWKTFVNDKDGYSIQYPPGFHPEGEHNLVNYDTNDPKYEWGNSNGVKIQIQKFSLNRESDSIEEMLRQLNEFDPCCTSEAAREIIIGNRNFITQYTSVSPGGAFMKYILQGYRIIIFEPGYSNNKELVEQIVATFVPKY